MYVFVFARKSVSRCANDEAALKHFVSSILVGRVVGQCIIVVQNQSAISYAIFVAMGRIRRRGTQHRGGCAVIYIQCDAANGRIRQVAGDCDLATTP